MGTRNLTIVRLGGKTKVAQYGQWDGYPTGQGSTIARFLKKVNLDKFKKQISELGEYTEEDIDQAYKDAGHDGGEWIKGDVSDKKNKAHPALCRDHAAEILELIYDGLVTKVQLMEDFKKDTLFCEYCYEIDLDAETVSVNDGKKYAFKEWTEELMKKIEKEESET